jgi:hypothetical protein
VAKALSATSLRRQKNFMVYQTLVSHAFLLQMAKMSPLCVIGPIFVRALPQVVLRKNRTDSLIWAVLPFMAEQDKGNSHSRYEISAKLESELLPLQGALRIFSFFGREHCASFPSSAETFPLLKNA